MSEHAAGTARRPILLLAMATGLAALLLASCASGPGQVVEVKVPVAVPCLERPVERPQFALDDLALEASDDDLILTLWIERLQRREYETRLEAALAGCQ